MHIPLTERTAEYLMMHRSILSTAPRSVIAELLSKKLIKSTVFESAPWEMTPTGNVVVHQLHYGTNLTFDKKPRKVISAVRKTRAKKEFSHLVPGSVSGTTCSIICADCGAIESTLLSSLHQKTRCKKCTMSARAKAKKEHRNAKRSGGTKAIH